jgi:hypothetical protein
LIKARRRRGAWDNVHMRRGAYRVLVGKPEGKKSHERISYRRENKLKWV